MPDISPISEERVTFTAGNHDLYRTQFSRTGPLGDSKKLFYQIGRAHV